MQQKIIDGVALLLCMFGAFALCVCILEGWIF